MIESVIWKVLIWAIHLKDTISVSLSWYIEMSIDTSNYLFSTIAILIGSIVFYTISAFYSSHNTF